MDKRLNKEFIFDKHINLEEGTDLQKLYPEFSETGEFPPTPVVYKGQVIGEFICNTDVDFFEDLMNEHLVK